jgi:hypothetical protein
MHVFSSNKFDSELRVVRNIAALRFCAVCKHSGQYSLFAKTVC